MSSRPTAPRRADLSPRAFVAALIGIIVLTACVHARAFANPFLFFDDPQNVLDNAPIRALTLDNLKIYFTTPLLGMYSPLVYLSYAFDYRIGGFDATVYHVTNLALHLVNVVLAALVVRRLTGDAITGLLVALLFAVHPMNVAGVAPLSLRSGLLYSAFYLGAYLAYLKYTQRLQPRWLAASLICFVLAGLSKSAAIVFPAVLLATDIYLNRKWTRAVWLEKLPFFVVAVVFAGLGVVFRSDIGATPDFSLVDRVWLALYSLAYYGYKLVLPIGLSPFHPYPQRVDGHLPSLVYVGAFAVIAVVALAWLWRSQRRLFAFGGLFFLINIALVLKIVPIGVEFVADRYVYLPSIGLLLIAVVLARQTAPAWRRLTMVALAGVAVWFSAASYVRAEDWRDRLAFESGILRQYPDDPDAHAGLGIALREQNRLDEAAAHLERAAALDPANGDTRVNLCAVLQKLGRFPEAVTQGRDAVRLRPQQADAHTNLAAALEAVGRIDEAASEYAAAARLAPDSADAHANVGRILLAQDRAAEAVAELRRALQLGSTIGSIHYFLGGALAETDQLDAAVTEYETARRDPAQARAPELHNDLGVVLGRLGRTDAAVAEFREALRLDPGFEAARVNLARAIR